MKLSATTLAKVGTSQRIPQRQLNMRPTGGWRPGPCSSWVPWMAGLVLAGVGDLHAAPAAGAAVSAEAAAAGAAVVVEVVKGLGEWIGGQSDDCAAASLGAAGGSDCNTEKLECKDTGYYIAECPGEDTTVDNGCGYGRGAAFAGEGPFGSWAQCYTDAYANASAKALHKEGDKHFASGYGSASVDGRVRSKTVDTPTLLHGADPDAGRVYARLTVTNLTFRTVAGRPSSAVYTNTLTVDGQVLFHSVVSVDSNGNLQGTGPLAEVEFERNWNVTNGTWNLQMKSPFEIRYLINQLPLAGLVSQEPAAVTNHIEFSSITVAGDGLESVPALSVATDDGGVAVKVTSLPDSTYQLEYKAAIEEQIWRPAGAPVMGTGEPVTLRDPGASGPTRFYRVQASGQPTPPTIGNPPRNQAVPEGAPWSLVVEAHGTLPLEFLWYRNGEMLTSVQGHILTIPRAHPGDQGVYWVEVRNEVGLAKSPPVQVLVIPDLQPPAITKGAGYALSQTVVLEFSEPLLPESAMNPSHYQVLDGAARFEIIGVQPGPSFRVLQLQVAGGTSLTAGREIVVIVNGLRDQAQAANLIPNNSQISFVVAERTPGG